MQQTFSLVLAFILLVGSSGVPVSRHYCQGELKAVAFFKKAKKCHEDQRMSSCPLHADSDRDKNSKGCCDDEFDITTLDNAESNSPSVLPQLITLRPNFPRPYHEPLLLPARSLKQGKLEYYRPPPLVTDVPSQWQVYLI